MSTWVSFRDWFVVQVLPLAIAVVGTVIQNAKKDIKLGWLVTGIIEWTQPKMQEFYEKAIAEGDIKAQAILIAILAKIYGITLALPGRVVEVLSPEDANKELFSMAKVAMDQLPEEKKTWFEKWRALAPPEPPPEPTGN